MKKASYNTYVLPMNDVLYEAFLVWVLMCNQFVQILVRLSYFSTFLAGLFWFIYLLADFACPDSTKLCFSLLSRNNGRVHNTPTYLWSG